MQLPGADWSWHQRLRFFALGATWAALLSLLPVAVTLWDMIVNWSNPIDWAQVYRLTASCAGPALVAYWRKHKADLRMPPMLVIPPEFSPIDGKSKTVTVESGVIPSSQGQPAVAVEKKVTTEIEAHPIDPNLDKPKS